VVSPRADASRKEAKVDVETIATIASAVGAVILIIYRVAKLFEKPRRRQRLLEDLDILGKTPDTSPQHANVSKHVEDELRGLYDPKVQRAKPRINWGLVVVSPARLHRHR
jgi:hypothetical protein